MAVATCITSCVAFQCVGTAYLEDRDSAVQISAFPSQFPLTEPAMQQMRCYRQVILFEVRR